MNTPATHPITPTANPQLRVISREEHCISRKNISSGALRVLYRLHEAGFDAYLVGGAVRDLLLGGHPKDFDIATSATPEQVRALFRNCRLIGRRFRLAHVVFGSEIVEVATFRGLADDGSGDRHIVDGRIVRDNVYGTIEEDAIRRDFTVNALYYNIADFSVRDYVGGYEDVRQRLLRLIGIPELRYQEDPVRMLRAVRLAAKLDFAISADAALPFHDLGALLANASPARLFDECVKMFLSGHALQSFQGLAATGLLAPILPLTAEIVRRDGKAHTQRQLIERALANADQRVAEGKSVTPAFVFAALLWGAVQQRATGADAAGKEMGLAWQYAAEHVLHEQTQHVAIPRRISVTMQEIWTLQPRFEQRVRKRVFRLLAHPRFRAAYDFLLLRAVESDALAELGQWWTQAQVTPHHELADRISGTAAANQGADIGQAAAKTKKKRVRRRRASGAVKPADRVDETL